MEDHADGTILEDEARQEPATGRAGELSAMEDGIRDHNAMGAGPSENGKAAIPMGPTVISTFAGCGGSSLGYRWAGYKELLAIDFDPNACATFRLNFPGVPMWERDMRTVTVDEIMAFTGIKEGELDVLDGSPPCQGFSMAKGKRNVNDSRNDLFEPYVRLIVGLRPRAFVMENVPGQASGKMKGKFFEILRALEATGYVVRCRKMNAALHGVPQARERLFYVGVRPDLGKEPAFPRPSAKPMAVSAALSGLSDPGLRVAISAEAKALWMRCHQGNSFSSVHRKGSWFNSRKVDPTIPSPTVTKTAALYHWREARKLGINEVKRLCGFPDSFKLTGSFNAQWARLGNAVMPPMMKAMAQTIRKDILGYE